MASLSYRLQSNEEVKVVGDKSQKPDWKKEGAYFSQLCLAGYYRAQQARTKRHEAEVAGSVEIPSY